MQDLEKKRGRVASGTEDGGKNQINGGGYKDSRGSAFLTSEANWPMGRDGLFSLVYDGTNSESRLR